MSKKMTNFEFANKATDKLKMMAKLPVRKKALKRAFESAKDSLVERNMDLDILIDEKREALYTMGKDGDKDDILMVPIESKMEMGENALALKYIEEEEAFMNEEAPAVDEEE